MIIFLTFLLCIAILYVHYEGLRLLSAHFDNPHDKPQRRMLLAMIFIFLLHLTEILIFAGAYWLADHFLDAHAFKTMVMLHWKDFVCFSVEVYSSLGYSDLYPLGDMRFMSGFEGLAGLLLLGWSTSFSYLLMTRLWPLHKKA